MNIRTLTCHLAIPDRGRNTIKRRWSYKLIKFYHLTSMPLATGALILDNPVDQRFKAQLPLEPKKVNIRPKRVS